MPPPVAVIATLDPRHRGGVLTLTRFLYNFLAQHGWEPLLVYNSIEPANQFPSRRNNFKPVSWRPRLETVEGMRGCATPLYFPQVESVSYLLSVPLWASVCRGADLYVAVGGGVQPAIPFALLGYDYFCWVSTTLDSERNAQAPCPGWKARLQWLSDLLLYPLERLAYRGARVVLAHSPRTCSDIVTLGIEPQKVSLLPVPVNTDTHVPFVSTGAPGNYITFVGRLTDPRKNVPLLLRALACARDRGCCIPAMMIGRYDQSLLELTSQLALDELVRFTGYVSEGRKIELLQQARFFVVPSLQEGYCIAAFEAMACGLPVVATRCGSLDDLIQHGETGLLVANGDSEALAVAMMALWLDPKRTIRMGVNARRQAVRDYSYSAVARGLERTLVSSGSTQSSAGRR